MRWSLVRWSLAAASLIALGCGTDSATRSAAADTMDGTGGTIGEAGGTGRAGVGGTAGRGTAGTSETETAGMSAAGMGTAGTGGDAGGGQGGTKGEGGAGPFYALDMNDVTILVPLPASSATPVLLRSSDLAADGTALVPRALVDRLVTDSSGQLLPTLSTAYERLQLVAVRFDLCDRHLPGACPEAEDARLRLVFQPTADGSGADDVGFHAFYTIRNDEIAGAVASLRELAQSVPAQAGPLHVSPALSAANPEPYATRLRTFVKRYGGAARLVRLTMNALNLKFSAFVWALRGVEKQGDAFADMTLAGASESSESVTLTGSSSYDVKPITDTPSGLLGAITQSRFDAADAPTQREYLAALATVDNPMNQTAQTVACVACHVATVVTSARAASSGLDVLSLPGRYTSTFELSIAGGKSAETPNTLRALGYLRKQPMISQRVVNETAQTLTEIEGRYPPP